MATIQQIIDRANLRYPFPSNWTDQNKIDVINEEQREIFREIQEEAIYAFDTVADQDRYVLPSTISKEFISYVGKTTDTTITTDSNFREYLFAEPNQELTFYNWYDALSSQIGLYPIPENTGEKVKIIYKKRPTLLSTADMSASPDLNEDWHRIFIYALIIEVACSGNNPDSDVTNIYTVKYNTLMTEILQSRYEREPSYPSTVDTMKRRKRSRRNRRSDEVINPCINR